MRKSEKKGNNLNFQIYIRNPHIHPAARLKQNFLLFLLRKIWLQAPCDLHTGPLHHRLTFTAMSLRIIFSAARLKACSFNLVIPKIRSSSILIFYAIFARQGTSPQYQYCYLDLVIWYCHYLSVQPTSYK